MGKPPISDAAMRTMFQAMERLRTVRREASVWKGVIRESKAFALAEPESLLAGVLSQMHRRDTLVTSGPHPLLATAVQQFFPVPVASLHIISCDALDEEAAAFAAGVALKTLDGARDPKPVTVVLLRSFPALQATLRLLEHHDLPLLVVAQGEAESRSASEKRVRSTQVPILPVDAADAVAVCRVMQESLLRARSGWGGAVIHAIHVPGAADAVLAMRKRLEVRGLSAAGASLAS